MSLTTRKVLSTILMVAGSMVAGSMVATRAFSAPIQFEMTVDGSKQGKFKGDSTNLKNASSGKIAVIGFSFAESSPIDLASGQASGRRQHQPITIVKEWDAASPQFLQALVTNERLSLVTLDLSAPAANGVQAATFQITLTNAAVVGINQSVGTVNGVTTVTETIQLSYQRLDEEDLKSKVSAVDDWQFAN